MADSNCQRLRLLTYMAPDIPLETFTVIRDCIEEATGLEVDLMVEDRYSGPCPTRANPFTQDLADIVMAHSSDFLQLKASHQSHMELCPVAPVYKHSNVSERPVYFSEIIVHGSNHKKFKEMKDLKGCSWAYNSEKSLSGNLVVLNFLKTDMSTNSTFFGNIVETGSHLASIRKVIEHSVDAAAVDSTVLAGYLREHPDHEDKLVCLKSLGPLPIYPTLFNSRLSGMIKQKIIDKLLSLSSCSEWSEKLSNIGIAQFAKVDQDLYGLEVDVKEAISGMKINTAYY